MCLKHRGTCIGMEWYFRLRTSRSSFQTHTFRAKFSTEWPIFLKEGKVYQWRTHSAAFLPYCFSSNINFLPCYILPKRNSHVCHAIRSPNFLFVSEVERNFSAELLSELKLHPPGKSAHPSLRDSHTVDETRGDSNGRQRYRRWEECCIG